MKRTLPIAIPTAVIIGAAALIKPAEGLRLRAYPDPANPALATICYGETQGVHFGDIRTQGECEQMLADRLPDYLGPIYELLPDLPDNRAIAYGDAAWNMGVGILTRRVKGANGQDILGTSIVDLERVGKWQDACKRLGLFVYAGGKKLPGLVKRRQKEMDVCLNNGEKK